MLTEGYYLEEARRYFMRLQRRRFRFWRAHDEQQVWFRLFMWAELGGRKKSM